ncbi:MAG: twin-arginine translocase TatA/TatE family subunit, partial [Acidimicrobiales bacterium]
MGDITPLKILIVAVIALLVLGPERLPEMTRKAGKAWADFKSFRANLESQVRETVGDVPGFNELSKLSKLTNAGIKSTIASSVSSAMSMPTSAGPTSAGPTSAGPTSAGPTSAGPTSAGPTSAGPTSAGPTS